MMGERQTYTILAYFLLIVMLVTPAIAQTTVIDSDGDGIGDNYDGCPGTISKDDLPVVKQGTKNLGCSCEQIRENLDVQDECLDFFCYAGRPLSIRERAYSSKKIECGKEYCIGDDLYAFKNNEQPLCINGYIDVKYCEPKVTLNSELCINGSVSQKPEEKESVQEIFKEDYTNTINQPVITQTYHFAEEMYDFVLENDNLKNYLGNPSRDEFLELVTEFREEIPVEKASIIELRENKVSRLKIPIMTIKIVPPESKTLKKLVVFERISTPKVTFDDLVFNMEPDKVLEGNVYVWMFDQVNDIEINYHSKTPVALESETLLVADIKTVPVILKWWPLLLIPLFAYAAYRYMTEKRD